MATVGTSDIEKAEKQFFYILCAICKGENKDTEADKFCSDCHTYYCSKCVNLHEYIPTLKGHKTIDKAQFSPATSLQFPVVPTERCEQHRCKPVDMYCKQHDTVDCASCMAVKHKDCKDIFYVPEYIKSCVSTVSPKDVSTKLTSIATSLKEVETTFTKKKQMLANSKGQALKQIQKFRAEINQKLDILEEKMVTDLEQLFKLLLDQIDEYLRDLQASAAEAKSTLDSLQSASGNQSQLFVIIKKASTFAEKINSIKTAVSKPEISFSENPKLMSLLQETEYLGSITSADIFQSRSSQISKQTTHVRDKTTVSKKEILFSENLKLRSLNQEIEYLGYNTKADNFQSQAPTSPENTASGQHTPSLLKIKGKKKTNSVTVKTDRNTCSIISACVLEDGTVILADIGNSRLKRLDSSTYTVRDCCDVPSWPFQVCVINQQEVAVVCSRSQLIQFVSVGSTMQTTRQIHTDHGCNGLAYADDKLFVSDRISVYVYTMTGDRLQHFSKDQCGQSLFSCLNSLAFSRFNHKIYVADIHKGLGILNRYGNLVRKFNSSDLSKAAYICMCNDGSILVCGLQSQNVVQFTADGELIGEVLKTDEPCTSVCWNNSKLIVGYSKNNNIDCYDTCT